MAITTRYATNMAMQYNEVDLSNFLINPSVGSRRFLTEAEQTRLLRATETSALYFITDTSGTFYSARYRWYDSGGTLLNEHILSLSTAGVHNSIPIDWSSFYVPSGAVKMTVAIIGAVNGFSNGDFEQGTGNVFTNWTLTQPTRTNYCLYSQQWQNAAWINDFVTVTTNYAEAPDGTMTADRLQFQAGVNALIACALVSGQTPGAAFVASVWIRADLATNIRFADPITAAGVTIDITEEWQQFELPLIVDGLGRVFFELDNYTGGFGQPARDIIVWQGQLEPGNYVTPTILTTSAPVTVTTGEFLQDTTGGPDGSRCIRVWADAAQTTLLNQAVSLVSGKEYIIRFRAKADVQREGDRINIVVGATDIGDTNITDQWVWYSTTFTATSTASTSIYFSFLNDATYGFASIDDVSILPTSLSLLSEERIYLLDDSCVAYEYQLNWLNKLGGRDTWVMTGYPTETVEVNRNNQIEYSQRTNYTSPNRIYGYRENKSRKSITLTHQCKDRRTAEWLKSELIDSIDVMLLIDGVYYPCDVVPSSIVIRNTFSQDYTIRLTLRYAYDINVQTR